MGGLHEYAVLLHLPAHPRRLTCGCHIIEGSGSRVKFGGPEGSGHLVATFHRPHPAKEAKPYQVRDARAYLEILGITPTTLPE